MRKPRSVPLRKFGELFIGMYLICITYMLVESDADRTAFMKAIPLVSKTMYQNAIL